MFLLGKKTAETIIWKNHTTVDTTKQTQTEDQDIIGQTQTGDQDIIGRTQGDQDTTAKNQIGNRSTGTYQKNPRFNGLPKTIDKVIDVMTLDIIIAVVMIGTIMTVVMIGTIMIVVMIVDITSVQVQEKTSVLAQKKISVLAQKKTNVLTSVQASVLTSVLAQEKGNVHDMIDKTEDDQDIDGTDIQTKSRMVGIEKERIYRQKVDLLT